MSYQYSDDGGSTWTLGRDGSPNQLDQINDDKLTGYFVKRLTRLGHPVKLEPSGASV